MLTAIKKFEQSTFNYKEIREHALKFSKQRFEMEIKKFVEEKYSDFKSKK